MRHLLIILFALFSFTGNGQIFETQFEKGSFIDRINNDVFTLTGTPTITRTEKGLVLLDESGTSLGFENAITLSKDATTIVVEFKGFDESGAVKHIFYGGSGGEKRLIKNTNDIELESNTPSDYWFDKTTSASERASFEANFQQLIIIASGGSVTVYLNNEQWDTGTPSDDVTFTHINTTTTGWNRPIKKVIFYDHAISSLKRNRLYTDFINSYPAAIEKHPKYGDWNKPTSLNDRGLVAAYNMIPSAGGVLTDISNNSNNGTINGAISSVDGMLFDGTDDNVVLGNVGNVKSISFRIKPKSTTEKILEGAANDKLIHINAGTLTYPDYDDAYVDGINTNTMVADQWQNITVVSSTDVDNTALTFALNNTTYGNFEIADLRLYSIELTEQQAKDYHNSFAKRVVLIDNFEYDVVGTAIPQGWTSGTGTYEIKELAAQDAVLKHLDVGTKYLECTTAGTQSLSGNFAYGTWEYSVLLEGAATNAGYFFIADKLDISTVTGYAIYLDASERIAISRYTDGTPSAFMRTASSYVVNDTRYDIKIERTKDGKFYLYIRGGAFGDVYILAVLTVGANPMTDNNHTSGGFQMIDLDIGDEIGPFKISEGVIQ